MQELSLHLMKSTHLYPDEFLKGGRKFSDDPITGKLLPRLRFPQEYPLTSHSNTILLVKSARAHPGLPKNALEIQFSFPYTQEASNKLVVQACLPDIEIIIDFKQLK